MFLGQWAVKDAGYMNEIARLHRRGDYILLDNGAAEPEEERVPFPTIVARVLPYVDEIALPDVLYDTDETIARTLAFAELVPPRKRMIIPQGHTWDEWFSCLQTLAFMLRGEFRTIGVPKHLERLGGRAQGLRFLKSRDYTNNFDVHLLGVWGNPHTEIQQAREAFAGVRGIDTGYPLAAAQAGQGVDPDRWGRMSLQNDVDPNPNHYVGNILTLRGWCTDDL
jgi:hypothetical protein